MCTCFDVLRVLVRLSLVVFGFTWFLSAGHVDCGYMCQTTLVKRLCFWWSFSLRLNLPVHRYFGKEGLSSCLDFFMVIMVVDFHGIAIVMPEKCLRTHPTRQLFKPGLRQGREHAATKSLKCQMLRWSRNIQITKAPVHNVPSFRSTSTWNCAKFALNSPSLHLLRAIAFCCLHARRQPPCIELLQWLKGHREQYNKHIHLERDIFLFHSQLFNPRQRFTTCQDVQGQDF